VEQGGGMNHFNHCRNVDMPVSNITATTTGKQYKTRSQHLAAVISQSTQQVICTGFVTVFGQLLVNFPANLCQLVFDDLEDLYHRPGFAGCFAAAGFVDSI
jgi:hypothetical protein